MHTVKSKYMHIVITICMTNITGICNLLHCYTNNLSH